ALIDQYENQARDCLALAGKATSTLKRERLLSLARAVFELANALKGRNSNADAAPGCVQFRLADVDRLGPQDGL
ncbi:MAG: hypothetical protein KGO48_08600, partial [Alphaproteobacteria bacterium]|nr:hypothetical protein [Alphaproteobacteria bacterium]